MPYSFENPSNNKKIKKPEKLACPYPRQPEYPQLPLELKMISKPVV